MNPIDHMHRGMQPFNMWLNYKHNLVCCATCSDLFYQFVYNEFTNAGSMYHLNGFVLMIPEQ